MSKDLHDDMLKLVRFKVLFVKRESERVLKEGDELVADNLDSTAYTAWKIAELEKSGELKDIPDKDRKYLRVYYEVLDRYPREKFKYEEDQIEVLKEIRDKLGNKVVSKDKPLLTIEAHDKQVNSVAFSPDGKMLMSASADTTAKLWDTTAGKLRGVQTSYFKGETKDVTSVAFSPKGGVVVLAHHANTGTVADLNNLTTKFELEGHTGFIPVATYSGDGTRIATASLDLTARIWDAQTGKQLAVLKGHGKTASKIPIGVWGVAFSPDGKTVATGGSDKTVRLWDAKTGNLKKTITGHQGLVFSVAFSPDGKLLASSSEDGTVCLWDLQSGKEKSRFDGDGSWIVCVSFSPDGKKLAAACYDSQVRVWDVENKKISHIFSGHSGPIHYVAFSPDGKTLASAGDDKTVRVWAV